MMKSKNVLIFLFISLLLPFTTAEDFTLDKIPVVYAFLKGTIASFKFEDKIYTLKLGDFDFKNERVTIQWMAPQDLGTGIIELDKILELDLDRNNNDITKNDVKITLVSISEEGINEDGIEGTANIKFETFLADSMSETSVTSTTTTTTIKENTNTSAGEEITGRQILLSSWVVTNKTWVIIGGVAILFVVLIVLSRKKIAKIFNDLLKKKGPKEHTPCPKCGRDTVVGDKFCIGCGAKLSAKPRFCTKCGERVRVDSKFCVNCGFKI